jgi:glutathione S-transferase
MAVHRHCVRRRALAATLALARAMPHAASRPLSPEESHVSMNSAHQASSTPPAVYRLIGRPESGYSVKVRSAMHFKGVAVEWLDRFAHSKLYQQHAKVQLIPLVLLPTGEPMQDSTPILEYLEAQHPEPSLHPAEPALRFLSVLMEDYGDEWANKLMFHYRWGYRADQQRRGASLAAGVLDGRGLGLFKPVLMPFFKRWLIRRMVPRLAFAGANENNAPLLVESFATLVDLLEVHLASRPYLFGGRPALGDFGLWGQLYQAYLDPSCEAILRRRGPAVVRWIERMEHPAVQGPFESLAALSSTLAPIYEREVARRFLAWSDANAKAYEIGADQTVLQMDGRRYFQKTFKYPASTLARVRSQFREIHGEPELIAFLGKTGCLPYLEGTA